MTYAVWGRSSAVATFFTGLESGIGNLHLRLVRTGSNFDCTVPNGYALICIMYRRVLVAPKANTTSPINLQPRAAV